MTLISPRIKLCAVCRVPNPLMVVLSASFFGTQDLDGRSGHLDFMGMEQCLWGSYCSPDLSDTIPQKTRDFVRSEDYRWHAKRWDLPDLARKFQCYSVLQEEVKNWLDAGHASLVAAWACDDAKHYLGSEYSRRRAIVQMNRALEVLGSAEIITHVHLMLTDIHRRLGEFEMAADLLEKIPESSEIEGMIRMMEERLITARDRERYNVKDIPHVCGGDEVKAGFAARIY